MSWNSQRQLERPQTAGEAGRDAADGDDDDAPGGPLIARQSAGVDAEHDGRKTDGTEPTEQQAERRHSGGDGHRWSLERFL